MTEPQLRVRLDKWLWAARFYKSRSLAQNAVASGNVQVNGQRVKPSRAVRKGDKIRVKRGDDDREVLVKQLSQKRGSANIAQQLYAETEESLARRERKLEIRKTEQAMWHPPRVRPDRLKRRLIRKIKQEQGDG